MKFRRQPIDWDQKTQQISAPLKGQKKGSWSMELLDEALQWSDKCKMKESEREMELRWNSES